LSRRNVGFSRYFAMRVAQAIPLFFAIIIINFVIIHFAPGDPASRLAGEFADANYLNMIREKFGLNKPLYEQLALYIYNVLRGDFGYSFYYEQPVIKIIESTLPNTLLLMGPSLLMASLVGLFLGVVSSRKPYSVTDNTVTVFSLVGYSLPIFWLGQVLLIAFSLDLGWFPSAGMASVRVDQVGLAYVADVVWHLFLPSVVLVVWQLALLSRLTRASMLEVFREDYIITARAKGLPERTVIYKHALRNALLAVVTVIGVNVQYMFAGAVLTETVFSWPGIGRLFYNAIFARDYPLLMGMFIIISLAVIVSNLIVDLLYGYLDPRIRFTT